MWALRQPKVCQIVAACDGKQVNLQVVIIDPSNNLSDCFLGAYVIFPHTQGFGIRVCAVQLAHQWFGNLVTAKDWTQITGDS